MQGAMEGNKALLKTLTMDNNFSDILTQISSTNISSKLKLETNKFHYHGYVYL